MEQKYVLKKYDYENYIHVASLLNEDDVAYSAKEGWRTPTKAEWQELLDNTSAWRKEYTYYNEELKKDTTVYGFEFTSRKNGNKIFLPITGYMDGFDLHNIEPMRAEDEKLAKGAYWASDLCENDGYYMYASALIFGRDRHDDPQYAPKLVTMERYKGLAIRPVRKP